LAQALKEAYERNGRNPIELKDDGRVKFVDS